MDSSSVLNQQEHQRENLVESNQNKSCSSESSIPPPEEEEEPLKCYLPSLEEMLRLKGNSSPQFITTLTNKQIDHAVQIIDKYIKSSPLTIWDKIRKIICGRAYKFGKDHPNYDLQELRTILKKLNKTS